MFKVLLVTLLIAYCNAQLVVNKQVVTDGNVFDNSGLYSGLLQRGILPAGLIQRAIVPGGYLQGGLFGNGLGYQRINIGGLPSYYGYGGAYQLAGLAQPVVAAKAAIPAAIQTVYSQEVLPIQNVQQPSQPQIIEVEGNSQPVVVHFRSQSSPVQVEQSHIPGEPGQTQTTRSEDEPHRVIHEVIRPVIQEVREIIQPYRRITQEIRPVEEEINSIIARGEGVRQQVLAAPIASPVALPGPIALPPIELPALPAPVVVEAPAAVAVEEPVAVAAPAAVAVEAPLALSAQQLIAQPITTSIIRQNYGGLVNVGLQGQLIAPQRFINGGGIVRFSRKYAESS